MKFVFSLENHLSFIATILLSKMLHSLISFIFILALLAVANCNVEQQHPWNFDGLQEPKGFSIFPISTGDPDSCQVELNFERDFNDGVHDYHLFAYYPQDPIPYYVLPVHYPDETQLAIVNTTAKGQRGAYSLSNGYTMTPVVYTACKKDKDGQQQVPEHYFIKMTEAMKGSESETLWQSPLFTLKADATIVPGVGVSNVTAKWTRSLPGNENEIEINWHLYTLFNEQVKGFFVLIGPSEDAVHIYSTFIQDPKATKTKVKIGYYYKNYSASVVVLSIDDVLTNPQKVNQTKITFPNPH